MKTVPSFIQAYSSILGQVDGLDILSHRLSTPRTTTELQFYIHDGVLNAKYSTVTQKKERLYTGTSLGTWYFLK